MKEALGQQQPSLALWVKFYYKSEGYNDVHSLHPHHPNMIS